MAATLRVPTLGDWTPLDRAVPELAAATRSLDAAATAASRPSSAAASPENAAAHARKPTRGTPKLQGFRVVGATGFEADETSAPLVADRSVNDADPTTQGDAVQPGVSASPSTPAPVAPAVYTSDDLPARESRRVFREVCVSGRVVGARREGRTWICSRKAWHVARAWAPPASAQPAPLDTDDAIRTAAKLAIDAGDVDRARALLDLLAAKPKRAPVLTFATRKPTS